MPESSQPANNDANRRRIHKRNLAIVILTAVFLFIFVVWFLYWFFWGRYEIYTDDAYVNGNMVQLMSQIQGTVTEITIDDTQLVKEGQVLIKFDPTDMKIELQHAEAGLAATVRQVRKLFEDAERAEATLVLRKADLLKAELDVKRRQGLVGESAVSHEEYQHYQTTEKTAQAAYNVALHNLISANTLIANTTIYTHPLVEQAKVNLKIAYLNLQRTVIVAPVTGYIAKRTVQVGQRVMVNTPMLAIVPLNATWVDANYKESQLSHLRIGQSVVLYADAYPDMTYHGKVFGLNPGTGAAFSLLPPQNATGNWIKIVQRLPVRIALDPDELIKRPLQLGLSMHVTIYVRKTLQTAQLHPIYTTNVYTNQLGQVDQLINSILQDSSPNMSARMMK